MVDRKMLTDYNRWKESRDKRRRAPTVKGTWARLLQGTDRVATAKGPLTTGMYVALNDELGTGHMPVYPNGMTDDCNYVQVLEVGGKLVMVPEDD